MKMIVATSLAAFIVDILRVQGQAVSDDCRCCAGEVQANDRKLDAGCPKNNRAAPPFGELPPRGILFCRELSAAKRYENCANKSGDPHVSND
jgi:hypothetical protein